MHVSKYTEDAQACVIGTATRSQAPALIDLPLGHKDVRTTTIRNWGENQVTEGYNSSYEN